MKKLSQREMQESDSRCAKASEESDQKWWRTYQEQKFDKTWTNAVFFSISLFMAQFKEQQVSVSLKL